jgi:hypothetical protein
MKNDEGFLREISREIQMGAVKNNTLRIVTKQAESFLRGIAPYSRRKNRAIGLALEYRDTIGKHGDSLTDDIKKKRLELMEALQALT